MASPRITALIDTYNYGRFIDDSIESVLSQGFPTEQLEVLVVDDGSTDDTRERMGKYVGRVGYLHKPNGGQASAFNFGIARAQADIIALLDADDYWLPGKLRRVVEEFEKHPEAGLVYHPLRRLRTITGEWRDSAFDAISGDVQRSKKKILQYTATQTSGLAFRKRFVTELLPLNESMMIDADAVLSSLIIFLAPVVAVPEPLGVYRIHGDNLYFEESNEVDQKRQARRIANLRIVLEEIEQWLTAHGRDLRQAEILAFRRRLRLWYEKEEFRSQPPCRMEFFLHLVRAMNCMNPCLNAKIQAVNVLNLAGSLLFGYDHYRRLDEWRIAVKRALVGSGNSGKGSADRRVIRDGAEGCWNDGPTDRQSH